MAGMNLVEWDILVPINMLEKATACLKSELTDRFRIHDFYSDKSYKKGE